MQIQFNIYTVITVAVICVFVLIVLLLFKFLKIYNISFGKFKFNSHGHEVEKCFSTPCSAEKINHFINNLYSILRRIDQIKNVEIEYTQMKYVKQKLSILKENDIDYFYQLINSRNKSKEGKILRRELNEEKVMQMYECVSYRVYREVLSIFEIIFIENHIDTYPEDSIEWSNYIDGKIKYLLSEMNKVIKYNYIDNKIVPLSIFMKNTEDNISLGIKEEFKQILLESRRIAIKYKGIIFDLEKEKENLVKSISESSKNNS